MSNKLIQEIMNNESSRSEEVIEVVATESVAKEMRYWSEAQV